MQYKEYGKTGKKVSVLGFGAMRFNPVDDEENAIKTIHRAVENGVNYFDTAPGYCKDKSETYLGNALSLLPPEKQQQLYLSTKTSIGDDPTADDVRRRIDDQLKKLKRDTIDFYTMWCIMDEDHYKKVLAPGGPYEGALQAKKEGLIEHIVCSAHARSDEIAKIAADGCFEGITLGYNIINHTVRAEGIVAAAEQNMAVVVMNPLGGGMLCHSDEKLGFLKEDENDSIVAASLRFVFSNPHVTVVLSGMGTPEQVDFNAKVANSVKGPDPEMVQKIIAKYDKLGEAFCTACRYCLEHCPEEIKINLYMTVWDRIRLGMEDEAKRLYQIFSKDEKTWFKGKKAAMCTQCGECETHCTQHLPLIEYLENVAEYFDENLP